MDKFAYYKFMNKDNLPSVYSNEAQRAFRFFRETQRLDNSEKRGVIIPHPNKQSLIIIEHKRVKIIAPHQMRDDLPNPLHS